MNINISPTIKYDELQSDKAKMLSAQFNLPQEVAKLLVARGIESVSDAENFLFFSADKLYDPYLLSGMKEVTERILQAVENEEHIVVYGDYDADGICGATILVKAITDLGGMATPYIPNRSEGYGLNMTAIEEIAENLAPDLIVTVDLGISCAEEIEYIFELGMDALVSDHHELPSVLPNCPKINPKIDTGKYPFTDLCGAGVALKIAQALMPNKFLDYIEYAAIATVADSVSLKDENRAIVKLGLEKINNNPSKAIEILLKECSIKNEVTSSTIAFNIAPRINAAGRMGDASRSLNLFLSEDENEIKEIVLAINADNLSRQKICEEIFKSGYDQFLKNSDKRAIVLRNAKWQAGLLGIVASKLSEEFHRPTILFFETEDSLRGSGRSIDGINLFEMLSSMSELFVTFGGHAQACGLTIAKENFEEFKERVELWLKENVELSTFIPSAKYDIDVAENEPNEQFIKSLEVLEPYGVGNPKPIFLQYENEIAMNEMKNSPKHLVGSTTSSRFVGFSLGRFKDVLRSPITKALFLDYSMNENRRIVSVQASIKDFYTIIDEGKLDKEYLLKDFLFSRNETNAQKLTDEQFSELIEKNDFGVLAIASTFKGIERLKRLYGNKTYLAEGNALIAKTNINRLLVSPKSKVNFEKFKYIVYAEEQCGVSLNSISAQTRVFSLQDDAYHGGINVKKNRELFASVYKEIYKFDGMEISFEKLTALSKRMGISELEVFTAYAVFKELNLFEVNNKKLVIIKGKKVELTDSKLYESLEI